MSATTQKAKDLATRTADAYSVARYWDWTAVCAALLAEGYTERQAEAILRSKWTRWAADASPKKYGRATAPDLLAYMKTLPRLKQDVRALVAETFPDDVRKPTAAKDSPKVDETRQKIVERVALAFANHVLAYIGQDKFDTVRRRNVKNGDCCASHDFCDANVFMMEALADCGVAKRDKKGEPVPDLDDDYVTGIWNEAWRLAKVMYMTGPKAKQPHLDARYVVERLARFVPDGANDDADGALSMGRRFLAQTDATQALADLLDLFQTIDGGEHDDDPVIVAAARALGRSS